MTNSCELRLRKAARLLENARPGIAFARFHAMGHPREPECTQRFC